MRPFHLLLILNDMLILSSSSLWVGWNTTAPNVEGCPDLVRYG